MSKLPVHMQSYKCYYKNSIQSKNATNHSEIYIVLRNQRPIVNFT